jgi:hypothetical protein
MTQRLSVFLLMIIILGANLHAMESESEQPMGADACLLPLSFNALMDSSYSYDDDKYPLLPLSRESELDDLQFDHLSAVLPPIQHDNIINCSSFSSDKYVSFLAHQCFFHLVDDLFSKMINRRLLAYDLWCHDKESPRQLKVRTVVACEIVEEKLYIDVTCFDNDKSSIKDVSHQWLAIVNKPFPSFTTIIRRALSYDLIKTLLLFNKSEQISCFACSKSICPIDCHNLRLGLRGLILLKCLHIAHIECTKLPICFERKTLPRFLCPTCETLITSDDDYVIIFDAQNSLA